MLFVLFFVSSRRRHTRLQGDWSSDVCSSDLHNLRGQRRLALGTSLIHLVRVFLKTLCRAAPSSVSGSTYQATCTTMALSAGSDTITTAYPGDASYATSPGTLTWTLA